MAEGLGEPPRNKILRAWWLAAFFAAVLTLIFSIPVFWAEHKDLSTWPRIVQSLYSSAHLLLLHFEANQAMPARLYAAELCAVIFMSATGVAVVLEFFGIQLWLWWMVLRGNHTVVCGLGPLGRSLAKQVRSKGRPTLVIEERPEDPAVTNVEYSGGIVLVGKALDKGLLRRAGVRHASCLFAALESDSSNVGVAVRAADLAEHRPARFHHPLRILVHIVDPQLRTFLRERRVLAIGTRAARISTFNMFDNSARKLFLAFPLDYKPIAPNDERTAQLVLIGFGFMGEALLLQACRVGHHANLKKLKVAVIDHQAGRKERFFRSRYPQLDQVCTAKFHELDAEEPTAQTLVAKLCADPHSISTAVIAFDDDARSLSLALSLIRRKEIEVRVRVRLSDPAGLTTLIGGAAQGLSSQLTAFGSLAEASDLDQELDSMARALHEDYKRRREREGVRKDDPALRDWEDLDDDYIQSNRHAADHIPVKLHALGYHSGKSGSEPGETVERFTAEEVDLLGRMEHERWNAERFLAGWTLGPRDPLKRVSPYLVAWEALQPQIQEYDREAVRLIPGVLSGNGYQIYR